MKRPMRLEQAINPMYLVRVCIEVSWKELSKWLSYSRRRWRKRDNILLLYSLCLNLPPLSRLTSIFSTKTLYVNQLAQSLAHGKPWRNAHSCWWRTGVFGRGSQETSLTLDGSQSYGIVDEGIVVELQLKHAAEDWFKPVTVSSFWNLGISLTLNPWGWELARLSTMFRS